MSTEHRESANYLTDWLESCVDLPDKIQECIGRADLLYLLRLGELVLHSSARVNGKNHDNTDGHGDDSGGGVVDHRSQSHFSRSPAVQSCHTCKSPSTQYFQ